MTNLSAARQRLLAQFDAIPNPKHYFVGMDGPCDVLPRKVLCFTRSTVPAAVSLHYRFVLFVATEGAGELMVEGDVHHIPDGHALLIFPYQIHAGLHATADKASRWHLFSFELEHWEAIEPLRNLSIPCTDKDFALMAEIAAARLHCHAQGHWRADLVNQHCGLLLAQLLQSAQSDDGKSRPAIARDEQALASRICRFCFKNLDRAIHIRDIAVHCAMSETSLRSFFRATFHISIGRFLRRLRIQRACVLLRNEKINIASAAAQLGFADASSLSRSFKQEMGLSPKRYLLQQDPTKLPTE